MERTRIAMIGTGWRAGFFLRAAQALPDKFEIVGIVYHSEAGRERAAQWGAPLFASVEEMVAAGRPDYAIVSVSRKNGTAANFTKLLTGMGVPVLMETPPAETVEEMTDLYKACRGAKVQVAEQYQFQPMNAARLAVAASGQLGRVYQTRLNLPNGYHAISVHRKALGVGMALPRVWAKDYTQQRWASPGRYGDPTEEQMITVKQMVYQLDYGDRQAFNDLEGDQCRAWFRREYYNIRGEKGEIFGDEVTYMKDFLTPVHYTLDRMMTGTGTNLEGHFLRGIRGPEGFIYQNPVAPARLFDDEIAVATCMLKMADYVRGGAPFYGLADAMQDRYLTALTAESAAAGGVWIQAQPQIWME